MDRKPTVTATFWTGYALALAIAVPMFWAPLFLVVVH